MHSVLPHRWLERRLLVSGGRRVAYYTIAHNLYSLLAGGFEIALILRLTGSFERIVFFNLLFYILLYLAFVGGTLLIRSGRASRGFRIDLAVQAVGCGYVMLNFAHLGDSLILAGFFVFKGVSEGLFWSTRHSALIHSVADDRRDRWSLGLQTVTIVMGIVLPVLSGFAISYLVFPVPTAPGVQELPAGYFPVYALTGILALAALILSPKLAITPQIVHLHRVAALRRAPGKRPWLGYLFGGAFASICVSLSVGILNFHVLKTEFQLGLFASWIAAASALFFFGVRTLVQRFSLTRVKMVFLGISGEFFSRLTFTLFPSVGGLVAKSLLDSFIVPLRSLFGENILRRRIELLSAGQGLSVAEGILFQETVLLIARVFCCLVLIMVLNVWNFDPVAVARTLLAVFMLYPFVDFLFLRTLDRGNRPR